MYGIAMLRFKQFSGSGGELERAVNDWLTQFEPDVRQMSQTVASDGSVSMAFLFEESFRGQEIRLASEHGVANATGLAAPAAGIPDDPIIVPEEPGYLSQDSG
jgi:hypothetical protein